MYFGRKYKLSIGSKEITDLRINFSIEKSLVGYPNIGEIKIYNLSKSSMSAIKRGDKVKLEAGYDGNVKLIFKGEIVNVKNIYTKPDWITEIYAGDSYSAIMNSTINKTLSPGATTEDIVNELANEMGGVAKGLLNGIKDCYNKKRSILKSIILSGSIKEWFDKISKSCGFDYAVEDDVLNTVAKNGVLNKANPYEISQETGMVGIPEQTEIGMDVATLLNGEYKLGYGFRVKSISNSINVGNLTFRVVKKPDSNTIYRINNIKHTGDSRDGEWRTSLVGQRIGN